ncbi:hypothetical protein GCM10011513_21370 [Franconibacter daqui]|uniref:hypothetical protein n=1 Tax=Franconibacter daqui TaxID=2047724 RepID=UPI00166877FB|nr:hypothetical protein [Franconibacter daqui]GGD23575.1 hypothetical protein GCM10011513_21370 [Franconibacter daqui]
MKHWLLILTSCAFLSGCSTCTSYDFVNSLCSKSSSDFAVGSNQKTLPSKTVSKPVDKANEETVSDLKLTQAYIAQQTEGTQKAKSRCTFYLRDIKRKYNVSTIRIRSANGSNKVVVCLFETQYPTQYGSNTIGFIRIVGNYENNFYQLTQL